ncbi:hypothetical protein [Marinicella rhabdoformis]|uniref:hypothetical protein n=1 Tax=Marinicella rhabdoformis TaxID=2580566 RepID=UPI0012AEBE6D|nr:hypothetical protein [Marinicella rhabdoformis]
MKTFFKKTSIIFAAVATSFTAHAGGFDDATWYVSLDIEQARAKLIPHLSEHTKSNNNFEFTALTPVGVNQVTMYGQSKESSTFTMVLSGQLGDFSAVNFINELEKQAGEDARVTLKESTKNNGHTIEHFVIAGDENNKSFYTAKLTDNTMVASFERQEVFNWTSNKYNTLGLHQTGLVTVQVNIASAMMHMGADIDQGAEPFQSHMFQKINQVSASLTEDQDDLLIEVALVTEDEAAAKQVNAVVNGLVAMNALSDASSSNKAVSALLDNLDISNKGNHVMILSHLPLAILAEIDFN